MQQNKNEEKPQNRLGLRYFFIVYQICSLVKMKQKRSKIDIIDSVYRNNPQYQLKQINAIANLFLNELSVLLQQGIPVEIRGLGSFDFAVLHGRNNARNPKTGEAVLTADRCKVRFKPGKELKEALHKIDTQELIES